MMPTTITILQGDCREVLATLPAESVHCCVTSPPYWGLRDYGCAGQLGLEPTPTLYVDAMVAVFREAWRVLRDDGTLWLNLGDSYSMSTRGKGGEGKQTTNVGTHHDREWQIGPGLKPKDLCGIPWRVAFALQADGWYLRQDIIWHKPNPMPESVTDRCTKAHEYVFLLTKSERYHYDASAIMEPCSESTHARISQNLAEQVGSYRANGGNKTNGPMRAVIAGSSRKITEAGSGNANNRSYQAALTLKVDNRNRRSVWTIPTAPCKVAHFATFPPDLIRPMIHAGCPVGGTVLDPFGGSGTTGMVAEQEGRNAVLIELNPEYIVMQKQRTAQGGLGI